MNPSRAMKLVVLSMCLAVFSPLASAEVTRKISSTAPIECIAGNGTKVHLYADQTEEQIEFDYTPSGTTKYMNVTWNSRALKELTPFVRDAASAKEGEAFLLKATLAGTHKESLFGFYAHMTGHSHPNMQIKLLLASDGEVIPYSCFIQ